MKTKKNPLIHRTTTAAFAAVVFAMTSPLQAATFTWDGGSATSNSWGNADNWDPNGAPTFNNTADLSFNNVTRPNNDIGGARTIRSISYGADMDSAFATNYRTFDFGAGQILTFDADAGNATITVDAGSTGNITLGFGSGTLNAGSATLNDNLDIVHNGSGLLLFNRPFTATAFGITKTGTGTMQTNNNNLLTGALNINQGTLIANTYGASGDVGNFSSVNLNGGTLQVNHNADTGNKSYINPFTVTAASTIAFYNSTSGAEAFSLAGPGTLALTLNVADLTMKNISSDTSLNNYMSIDRNITGAGDIIVETYNNINSGTLNFGLGRLGIGGVNSAWSGALDIRKGTAQVLGNYATADKRLGTGDIILGTTEDTFGAGLLLYADTGNGNKAYSNNITVRSGGFRTIRGGSDHTYTFDGNITLEGNLNVHNGLFFTDKAMIFNGDISGVGGLSITESGDPSYTRLAGNNTYSGATTIGAGVNLNINSATGTAIGDNSAVTFAGAGSILQFNSMNETVGSIASTGTDGAINLGANTLTTGGNNANTSFGGAISGSSTSGLTKLGNGTFTLTGINTLTGAINVDAGTLVAGRAGNADIGTTSAVNLNGGNLVFQPGAGFDKTYSGGVNVNSAGTLSYDNTNNTTHTLTLDGADLALDANLTVQNISTNTTLGNAIIISRNITGIGDLIVDGYNTITSSTTSFGLGRVALGSNNSGWSGDLVVLKGAAEVYGNTAVGAFNAGTGDIILGETGNTAGAAFILSASAPTGAKTLANDIIVRAGDINGVGFRTLRGNSDHSYNINGNITLEGNLNVHNGLFFNDKNMILNGVISGVGDLNVTKGTNGGFTRLTGNNSGWSGNLMISQGTVNLFGTANTPGTGDIVIGATDDATAAGLSFSHAGSLTYTNDIIVNTGGTRTIQGNSSLGINVTFNGGVTLNGDLTVDHTWSATDRKIAFSGAILGAGGLTITKTGGNAGTTALLSGSGKTYIGDTTVTNGASLSVTTSLTSDIVVQTGGRFGGNGGSTNQDLTMAAGSTFIFYQPTFATFNVTGSVTLDNTFGVDDLVGGSQGEVVPWATIPAATYTLITTATDTFSGIQNLGAGNAATGLGGGRSAYFQYAGGGLQLVVTVSASGYDAWKLANSTSGGLGDDHDGDGVDNGTEYFLFGNTDSTGFNALPGVINNAGVLSVTWTKAATGYAGAYDTDFVVETSDTLSGWTSVTPPTGIDPQPAGTVKITGNDVKYIFPTTGTKKFARLKVTGPN